MRKGMRAWGSTEEADPAAMGDDNPMAPPSPTTDGSNRDGLHIHFYEIVSPSSTLSFSKALRAAQDASLNAQMRISFDLGVDLPMPPIHLHIMSPGGDVSSGLACYDLIRASKVPIHTHVEGAAASAATLLSLAGTHRTIGANATMLIHQLSGGTWGKLKAMKEDIVNWDLMMRQIKAIYMTRAKFAEQELAELLERDLLLDPETCLRLGLVDEVR